MMNVNGMTSFVGIEYEILRMTELKEKTIVDIIPEIGAWLRTQTYHVMQGTVTKEYVVNTIRAYVATKVLHN